MERCPHCHAPAVQTTHHAWHLAHFGAWIYTTAAVVGAALSGPFVLLLVFPVFFGGVCLIAETHRRAAAPSECGNCGRYVVHHRAPTSTRPLRAMRVAG